jgi:hypothetical protein
VLVEPVEEPRRPRAVPFQSAKRIFGKRSQTPPAVTLTAAAMIPSGWLNVCHIIRRIEDLEREVGLEMILPAAVEADGDVVLLALAQSGSLVRIVSTAGVRPCRAPGR